MQAMKSTVVYYSFSSRSPAEVHFSVVSCPVLT